MSVNPTKEKRTPMQEFRLAERALQNARHASSQAQRNLDSARARWRTAFDALSPTQQRKVF